MFWRQTQSFRRTLLATQAEDREAVWFFMEGNRTAKRLSYLSSASLVPSALWAPETLFPLMGIPCFFAFHAIWFIPYYMGEDPPESNEKFFTNNILGPLLSSVFFLSCAVYILEYH
jgi:hypothetical protein